MNKAFCKLNYIGSKYKLLPFIDNTINKYIKDYNVFCDLFAGTNVVGRFFKSKNKIVIANDLEYYSYVLGKNYIELNKYPNNYKETIEKLNNLELLNGFIFENYSENGSGNRLYYSEYNGKKIDAIRTYIENYKHTNDYYFYLTALLEASDKIANVASVYGAYLKKIKKSAQNNLILESPLMIDFDGCKMYNEDAVSLIKKISGDVLYLDPPYNSRQYGANYHLLNTIAEYNNFKPQGKTGLRNYIRSNFCTPKYASSSLEEIIKNANFSYIFLSYNNEGLISMDVIKDIFEKYGKYYVEKKEHRRFKADNNRNYVANKTYEYIHVLEK